MFDIEVKHLFDTKKKLYIFANKNFENFIQTLVSYQFTIYTYVMLN